MRKGFYFQFLLAACMYLDSRSFFVDLAIVEEDKGRWIISALPVIAVGVLFIRQSNAEKKREK